jgi:hypothetical protein
MVDAAADTGVHNSQPEGIGRVATPDGMVAWNNLGRNVVFADVQLRPRAVFGTTVFPDDDLPSQFDLDVHAILDLPELARMLVVNHYGLVRGFRRADLLGHPSPQQVEPSRVWSFVADVERLVVVAGSLVGSSPRSDGAIGLLVTAPFDDRGSDGSPLPANLQATDLGEVSALGVIESTSDPSIAVGGDGRIALVPFADGRIGRPRWQARIEFRAATVALHDGLIFAAGPGQGRVDDYQWEGLSGGGFALLDPFDGSVVASGRLPEGVAWGTGGIAVAPFGPSLAAVDRSGGMHLVDPRTGHTGRAGPAAHTGRAGPAGRTPTSPVDSGPPETGPPDAASLGIGHMAVVGDRVLCGFNRGGYRLHSFCNSSSPGSVSRVSEEDP